MTSPGSRCDDILSLIDECLEEIAPQTVPVRDDPVSWNPRNGMQQWWVRSAAAFLTPPA